MVPRCGRCGGCPQKNAATAAVSRRSAVCRRRRRPRSRGPAVACASLDLFAQIPPKRARRARRPCRRAWHRWRAAARRRNPARGGREGRRAPIAEISGARSAIRRRVGEGPIHRGEAMPMARHAVGMHIVVGRIGRGARLCQRASGAACRAAGRPQRCHRRRRRATRRLCRRRPANGLQQLLGFGDGQVLNSSYRRSFDYIGALHAHGFSGGVAHGGRRVRTNEQTRKVGTAAHNGVCPTLRQERPPPRGLHFQPRES